MHHLISSEDPRCLGGVTTVPGEMVSFVAEIDLYDHPVTEDCFQVFLSDSRGEVIGWFLLPLVQLGEATRKFYEERRDRAEVHNEMEAAFGLH